jgi:DNA damage-binding protein 1
MSGEDLEEVELEGLHLDEQTIYCCNAFAQQYVQVTTKGVYLLNSLSEKLVASWSPAGGESITVCSCNGAQVLLAVGGTTLVLLEISAASLNFVGYVWLVPFWPSFEFYLCTGPF